MTDRVGFKPNLRVDVYRWFRGEELRASTSKTIATTAAVAALRMVSPANRDLAFQWAKLLDDEEITWAEFERVADLTEQERTDSLPGLWAKALERAGEGDTGRSVKGGSA